MISIQPDVVEANMAGFHIPAKPQVLVALQEVMNSEEPDFSDISDLISADIGLSGAILKTVNSPSYGMNREISDIKRAVCILGFSSINLLLPAFLLKKSFPDTACISLERFWDDSTDVANIMTFVGKQLAGSIPTESLYALGLFRNCGIPAMAVKYSDYKHILIQANERGSESQIVLENNRFKTNHAVIGYFIANSWNLPKPLCNLILQHHELDFLEQDEDPTNQISFAILKMSENIVNRHKRFKDTADWPYVADKVFDTLGICDLDYSDMEDEAKSFLT
ncbi:HDOD domain-containing protein [Vibrio sp. Of7-15]|uniref:HDOD domain-containing protein n=1 Tax=Vibrio sp. Of7-15 TaxID=2724879 RepID=UPI001EF36851|nr:HDOD domain-containing protein [Vibrio sp. Of7-15]MCG7495671.1 HDOD domain-containing protein [Vibrio sp. Of7-15]